MEIKIGLPVELHWKGESIEEGMLTVIDDQLVVQTEDYAVPLLNLMNNKCRVYVEEEMSFKHWKVKFPVEKCDSISSALVENKEG